MSASPPSLHVHYRHFNTTTGQSATEGDFGTFLPCSSLSAFPLTFRLLLPKFRQQACITVLPPLCRMPQCNRQVGSKPFIYRCAPRGTRTGPCPPYNKEYTYALACTRKIDVSCGLRVAHTSYDNDKRNLQPATAVALHD